MENLHDLIIQNHTLREQRLNVIRQVCTKVDLRVTLVGRVTRLRSKTRFGVNVYAWCQGCWLIELGAEL